MVAQKHAKLSIGAAEHMDHTTRSSHGWHWYAVQVYVGRERYVAISLRAKGYEAFLPLGLPHRECAPRVSALPLFPGYLFGRLNLGMRETHVVKTPQVIRLVGIGSCPKPVPDEEIKAIKQITDSSLLYEAVDPIGVGENVVIVAGPLRGLKGRCLRRKGSCRLVLGVTIVDRAVSVEIDDDWAQRAEYCSESANSHCF